MPQGNITGMFDAKDFVEVEINRNILLRASAIRSSISAPPIRPMEWLRKLWIQPTPFIWRLPPSTARLNFTHATTIRRGARYLLSPFNWSGVNKICGKYSLNRFARSGAGSARP